MNIKTFLSQFKNDWKHIIWPGKADVVSSFILTLVLAFVFGLFFLIVDRYVSLLINYLLTI